MTFNFTPRHAHPAPCPDCMGEMYPSGKKIQLTGGSHTLWTCNDCETQALRSATSGWIKH